MGIIINVLKSFLRNHCTCKCAHAPWPANQDPSHARSAAGSSARHASAWGAHSSSASPPKDIEPQDVILLYWSSGWSMKLN